MTAVRPEGRQETYPQDPQGGYAPYGGVPQQGAPGQGAYQPAPGQQTPYQPYPPAPGQQPPYPQPPYQAAPGQPPYQAAQGQQTPHQHSPYQPYPPAAGRQPSHQGVPHQVAPGHGVPGRSPEPVEPDGWGVYDPAQTEQPAYPWLADQTLQLRKITVPGEAAGVAAPSAEPRRASGRVSVRSGSGRRRATGRRGPVVRPKERKRVLAARAVGELFITLGMVMLLFVAYQLWWTNVQADAAANATRNQLEQQWNNPVVTPTPAPGQSAAPAPTFAPGKGFAIIHIPKIGLTDPVAEGTDTTTVLDHGLVGHYTGTAMPSDAAGNFAVAGHRTTHGQPFNRLAELSPGDKIVVETQTTYYTYEVEGGIPETNPHNVTVLNAIPGGSPFTQAGRYITMTTCTPEYSARGRLIVFGKMVGEQPRSQGQPPALTNG
ncbi:class E sortase [Kitasatospora sp. LaBMicrA B282]|uniref:class E sortase n=1 Tax=Kitasatospora sp. LaBMicrA B282 TaxID=3420949 RepID=UPI003D0D19BB